MTDSELLQRLVELERQLHKIEVRRDPQRLGELLHADFEEIGRSGRRYGREDVLAEFRENASLPLIHAEDFSLAIPLEGIALLTYRTAHVDESGNLHRWALRTSIWMHESKGWRVRFHQGTPIEGVRRAPEGAGDGAITEATWVRGEYEVTCDPSRQDRALIARVLSESYWAIGIPREIAERSLDHSLGFSLLEGGRQIGFARVISDYATIAYVADVFVLPEHRGRGLGKWLVECVLSHPELQGLRRWILATRDAHGLYAKYGFTALRKPGVFMERHDPDVYRRG